MFVQIKNYLQKAYPYYYENQRRLLILLIIISTSSFLFSYLFEPFIINVAEHKLDHIYILLLHAFLPLPIAFCYFFILSTYVKDERSWTLAREVFHISLILLIIGIANFLIRDIIYTNPDNWSFRYFWEEIRNTFLIGFLLIVIILPLNLERLFKKYHSSSKKLNINSQKSVIDNDEITIEPSIESEQFQLKLETFIFAKAEGNYVEFYIKASDETIKKLVRLPIKVLEKQLQSSSFIYRTHRSYLINTNYIKSVSGNAQGYNLSLKNCSETIPVSRSKIPEFNTLFTSS